MLLFSLFDYAAPQFLILAKSEENAALFGKTDIPKCVVDNLRNNSLTPPSRWTSISIEHFSVFVVLNLAQCNGSKMALVDAETVKVIQPMMSESDLQGLKVTMACTFLEAEWIGSQQVWRWRLSRMLRGQ